jgi:hypothetical protein
MDEKKIGKKKRKTRKKNKNDKNRIQRFVRTLGGYFKNDKT